MDLRVTEDPVEIFGMVLKSLEAHRAAKAERDILDDVREHFSLSKRWKRWPEELIRKGVTIDAFVKYVLDRLSPFVEMDIDLYEFLYEYASTTGGKTQHFTIDSESVSRPWSFDVSRLPRKARWIQAWMNTLVEDVAIDWKVIDEQLRIDNGIFYGTVDGARLIQSLIVARRDGTSEVARRLGDRVYATLKRAVRAWYRGATRAAVEDDGHSEASAAALFLSAITQYFVERSIFGDAAELAEGSIDFERLLADPANYTPAEVFRRQRGTVVSNARNASGHRGDWSGFYSVLPAFFFCAIWGLDDWAFRDAALNVRSSL
jgi:hypothetical protein